MKFSQIPATSTWPTNLAKPWITLTKGHLKKQRHGLLVCAWRHGGAGGGVLGLRNKNISLLWEINPFLLSTNMAALSRGCKLRIGTKSVRFAEQFQLEIAALGLTCVFSAKRFKTEPPWIFIAIEEFIEIPLSPLVIWLLNNTAINGIEMLKVQQKQPFLTPVLNLHSLCCLSEVVNTTCYYCYVIVRF